MHFFILNLSHNNMYKLILEILFSLISWDIFSTNNILLVLLFLSKSILLYQFYIKTCTTPKVHII